MGLLDKLNFGPESETENDAQFAPQFAEQFATPFAQDPEPGTRPARGRKTTAKAAPAGRKVAPGTAKLAREVAEDFATLLEGTAAVWGLRDQCCAPVLEQQAKPIADALVAILARNPRLLARFADTSIAAYTMQSVALGKALLPVGKAVYHNHIGKAVDDDQEGPHHDGASHIEQFPPFKGFARSNAA